VVSFNDSLVDTSVNVSVFGPNISWVNVLNVSDGLFGYDFIAINVGDFVVNVSVVYENISVSKELYLLVVEAPIENISENISENIPENISENISEISIVDQKLREELFVLPGCSFYVERTVVGSDGLQAVFALLFSDGLTLERFEIVSGNITRGRSRNIVNDLSSDVFISNSGVSGVERHIDNIREHLPSNIKSSDWVGYSGSFVLHEPVTIRIWFRAPSWDDIISGHVPGSGRISYLTFAGDDFDFEGSTWWNSNWLNRKLITINSSQVETDLSNFPVLINITDTDLRDDAQDDGDDIAFVLLDDSTKLNHEIEMFNDSTGQIYAWVNITSLSSSEDTKIWMYYNNSGCTNQENIHGVWDSNFIGVWHFEESSGVAEDSTANELNGSFYGSLPDAKSSQIYLGQDFDGDNDYIEVTDPGSDSVLDFNYGDDITISVWVKPDTLPSYGCILNKDPYMDMNYGLQNVVQQLNIFYRDSADTYYPEYLTTENVLSIGTWSYATASYTFGTGSTAKIYIDGTERSASWNVGDGNDAPLVSNNPLWFGADDIGTPGSPDEEFDGIIDEVRISNIIRNSSWINTSYNTMKNQSTFINIESEEYITNTSVNSISPYIVTYSPFTITATGASGLDNVTLWYKYSIDNSTWWNSSFTYRKKITINSSQVVTDLVNFPILINLTDTNLTTKAQNDGDDIAFTNATGTKLSHEIENYNSSTGELSAWVNVTSLSSSVDTVLYLYYGNMSCTSQEDVAGTWDSNFLIVQHLNESYSTANDHYKDSTTNDHDGTFVGGDGSNSVSGIIDQALSFDGVDTALTFVDSSDFTTPSSSTRTYEAWVNLSTAPSGYQNIIGDYHGPCFQFNENQLNYFAGLQIKSNVLTWTPGTWYYIVCTVNGLTATNWYRDGGSVGMETGYTQSTKDPDNFWIGADENNEYFNGVIDEVRLSTKIRTLGWIQTCYNNQINSSSFYSLGTEEIWTQWNNVTNPDTSSPWSWYFDFPNGTGYYEFYSISKKSGSPDEIPPINADTICYFNEGLNTLPEIALINPQPNGTTGVGLLPMCQVWANDTDGDTLTVYWYENTTGSWILRNTNNSISANTIVSYNFSKFSNYSITYWWKVAINDSIDNVSSWFYFTTESIDTSVDTIIPYDQSTFLLTVNSTGISDLDNVSLYYRWSEDNRSWGVGIQNISIYEGFESGSMNSSLWDVYSSTAYGQNEVNNTNPNTGSYSWLMAVDTQDNYNLNELYTVYDFTGATNISIDFWQYDSSDEENDAPSSWNNHYDADAAAFTNDGTTWYEIIDAATLNIDSQWTRFTYNISSHPNFDQNVTSNFAIKFQQYDNWIYANDGRLWDNIYINFTRGGNGINWTLWNNASNPDNGAGTLTFQIKQVIMNSIVSERNQVKLMKIHQLVLMQYVIITRLPWLIQLFLTIGLHHL